MRRGRRADGAQDADLARLLHDRDDQHAGDAERHRDDRRRTGSSSSSCSAPTGPASSSALSFIQLSASRPGAIARPRARSRSASKTSATLSSIVVAPPGSAKSDCAWRSEVSTQVRVDRLVAEREDAADRRRRPRRPRVDGDAELVADARRRGRRASVAPIATSPPATSKRPCDDLRLRRSMIARKRSGSTPRTTIGLLARRARTAKPAPVTVGDAAITPATRSTLGEHRRPLVDRAQPLRTLARRCRAIARVRRRLDQRRAAPRAARAA